jgi:hypothetical protein
MRKLIYIITLGILFSCTKETVISPPSSAILALPLKDETCNTGVVVSSTRSTVTFTWKQANSTIGYELVIKNLITNEVITYKTPTLSLSVELNRNTPYSWYVNSLNSIAQVAKSEVWKFYNSGEAITNYSPYPAEIISPKMDEVFATGTANVNLTWAGLDVDKDIVGYDIYFGTTTTPPLFKTVTVNQASTLQVTVTNKTTYYWKVITKDKEGNRSDSGIFKFTVN